MSSSRLVLYISVALIATGFLMTRINLVGEDERKVGPVEIQGVVKEEPRQKGQSVYFDFEGYRIRTSLYPKISYGDVIHVEGDANEEGYIAFPKIEKVGQARGFQASLFGLRGRIEEKINKFLPEPQSSLLSGVLLGVEKGLPSDFEEDLRRTGTIHVVVVSGFNIGVVGGFLLSLAGFIRRRYALILALGAIIFYTLLTGAQAPTVRAAIMGGLAFSATFWGRQNLPFYSLLLAAFLMVMISPNVLVDIGFQLSFLATAGIILFREQLHWFLRRIPSPLGEDLTTTLSAQALVVPIIFFHFGQVSVISPLINALVLWTIPLVTYLGFAIAFFGLVFEPVGQLIAWAAWAPLSIFVWIIELGGNIPISLISIPEKNWSVLVAYYLALSIIIFILLKYVKKYKTESE